MIRSYCENYLVIGDIVGRIWMLDRRKNYNCVRSLKGTNGAVKDLMLLNKTLIGSCGLDRYLNVFHHKNNLLESHLYLKSKLNCMMPYELPEDEESEEELEDEDEEGEGEDDNDIQEQEESEGER